MWKNWFTPSGKAAGTCARGNRASGKYNSTIVIHASGNRCPVIYMHIEKGAVRIYLLRAFLRF
jgi:hypothetical protein